jgi:sphingomyelin phosphodiesterase
MSVKEPLLVKDQIIAHDLREMVIGSHTSQLFCITFSGLCNYSPVTPYKIPFPSPEPAIARPPVSGQPPLKIVHFSDIHIDPFYQTGANCNCTRPICCRPYTTADAPGNNSFPAGPYGDTQCDAPVSLEESMYAAIKRIAPDAVATLFTGDIVDHAIWLVNVPQNAININDAYTRMSGLTRVYGTAGNHEAAPVNSFPPKAVSSNPNANQRLYNTLSSNWTQWIGHGAAREALDYEAYASKVPCHNLRIISTNTNFYYTENFWMYEKTFEKDPDGRFAWLVGELQAAEIAGERVCIIGHTPLGNGDVFHDASNYFNQIVDRYSATIAGLFFGRQVLSQPRNAY